MTNWKCMNPICGQHNAMNVGICRNCGTPNALVIPPTPMPVEDEDVGGVDAEVIEDDHPHKPKRKKFMGVV